jgi:CheY-like chemotaxis protein
MTTRTEEPVRRSAAGGSVPTKSILLADDQKDERAIQRVLLEHLGYQVAEATDGEMALEMARRMSPDLILLDIAMPKLDGLEVCRAVRSDPRTCSTAVLFYTASAAGDNDERLKAVGGDGVLIKPLEPKEVADAIAHLIGPAAG